VQQYTAGEVQICDVYIENFLTNHRVKEFCKSVRIGRKKHAISKCMVFVVSPCNHLKQTAYFFNGTYTTLKIYSLKSNKKIIQRLQLELCYQTLVSTCSLAQWRLNVVPHNSKLH